MPVSLHPYHCPKRISGETNEFIGLTELPGMDSMPMEAAHVM